MNKSLVSIFIAAYNLPEYSSKTLQSIVEQDYRPIELVFSDDCSPINLSFLIDNIREYESEDFIIRFFSQPVNLRGADNIIFGFDHCTGSYVVNMPHDDWWIDRRFLSEAVNLMEQNPECYLCVANSIIEKTDSITMIHLPDCMENQDTWQILPGDAYINLLGYGDGGIGHQAWSGIVFNLPIARSMGAFHYPFNLTKDEADALKVISDEFFAFQFLLSSIGSVAITEKAVSVRGRPETSFCNVNYAVWSKVLGQTGFVIYYNIYKAELHGKYAKAIKKRALKTIFHYPVEKMNLKILKHYNYSSDAIWLMFCSYLIGLYRSIFNLPRHYYFIGKRVFLAIRNRELSQLIAKQKVRGLREILRLILPS